MKTKNRQDFFRLYLINFINLSMIILNFMQATGFKLAGTGAKKDPESYG